MSCARDVFLQSTPPATTTRTRPQSRTFGLPLAGGQVLPAIERKPPGKFQNPVQPLLTTPAQAQPIARAVKGREILDSSWAHRSTQASPGEQKNIILCVLCVPYSTDDASSFGDFRRATRKRPNRTSEIQMASAPNGQASSLGQSMAMTPIPARNKAAVPSE